MSRRLTPRSSLDTLKKEARRWLNALRAGDRDARARLERALANAPAEPTLRQVQLALAREYGLPGWPALKQALEDAAMTQRATPHSAAIVDLLSAAASGDGARVEALLEQYPDIVNERALIPGHTGLRTALHHAIRHEGIVRSLLAHGADPDIRDEGDHAMPLHFAAEIGNLTVIRMLIEHGADPVGTGDYHELEVIGWAAVFGGAGRMSSTICSRTARSTTSSRPSRWVS